MKRKPPSQWKTPKRKVTKICFACDAEFFKVGRRQSLCGDCCADPKNGLYLLRYGITKQDVEFILTTQGGKCALCRVTISQRNLHVDHCHRTKKIRGILCPGCNHAIARAEVPEWMNRVDEYLKRPEIVQRKLRNDGSKAQCEDFSTFALSE